MNHFQVMPLKARRPRKPFGGAQHHTFIQSIRLTSPSRGEIALTWTNLDGARRSNVGLMFRCHRLPLLSSPLHFTSRQGGCNISDWIHGGAARSVRCSVLDFLTDLHKLSSETLPRPSGNIPWVLLSFNSGI